MSAQAAFAIGYAAGVVSSLLFVALWAAFCAIGDEK